MKRGYATYGHAIGIIMLDCHFTRIPGDMGNASTFDYPVLYKVVRGVPVEKIVTEGDARYLAPFVDAARELESCGVRAITTSCGCLALFQKVLSAAVGIPLFASTLVQVPLIHQMLGGKGKVGILAADSRILRDEHFQAVGWSQQQIPIAIASLHDCKHFPRLMDPDYEIDPMAIEGEAVAAAKALLTTEEVRALVLECTNLVPYAAAIQAAVHLPIFDIVTLTNMVHDAVVRSSYVGHL
jgi:hypothetical protein